MDLGCQLLQIYGEKPEWICKVRLMRVITPATYSNEEVIRVNGADSIL